VGVEGGFVSPAEQICVLHERVVWGLVDAEQKRVPTWSPSFRLHETLRVRVPPPQVFEQVPYELVAQRYE
jgi:hypothetical protein